jgi:starvation-inducible outer membrane lipoprotein
MTYSAEIKELLAACEVETSIYQRKAVRAGGKVSRLTAKQRRQVEELSTERGYRRFIAERMSTV